MRLRHEIGLSMNENSKVGGTRFEGDSLNVFEFDGRVGQRDVAGKT
jgi:hypothetical protein